jgi:hypothetical protein
MAHFYSSIQGARGEATRQGSKESGIRGYVQSWMARIESSIHYNRHEDRNDGGITLTGGPSSYARSRYINLPDIDTIIAALDAGDPKVDRIWERITSEFDKLAVEAPKAMERKTRRERKAERERERKARQAERDRTEIIKTLKSEEKARLSRILDVNWDDDGNLESGNGHVLMRADLRYCKQFPGHVCVNAIPKRAHQLYEFDVSAGLWVLPFEPEDLGIDLLGTGFGYRIQREEVTA